MPKGRKKTKKKAPPEEGDEPGEASISGMSPKSSFLFIHASWISEKKSKEIAPSEGAAEPREPSASGTSPRSLLLFIHASCIPGNTTEDVAPSDGAAKPGEPSTSGTSPNSRRLSVIHTSYISGKKKITKITLKVPEPRPQVGGKSIASTLFSTPICNYYSFLCSVFPRGGRRIGSWRRFRRRAQPSV